MTEHSELLRLRSLLNIAQAEADWLRRCVARLFAQPLTAERLVALANDDELAERIDAFVARFGRLQDTLGDKLLPSFLRASAERVATVLENLDRAEKLGLLASSDEWLALRKLRNRMIHEYVADPAELLLALESARRGIPLLTGLLTATQERTALLFGQLNVEHGGQ